MNRGRRSSRPRLAAATCAVLLASAAVAEAPAGLRLAELRQTWRDDGGRLLSLGDFAGRRVVVTMAYASCHQFCPATITELRRLQLVLDARHESAEFVIVSYDPAHDDAATWRQYRLNRRLDRANWHFLSGTREDTERFARQLGFEFWRYDEHVMHDPRVIVFDADGTLAAELGAGGRGWSTSFRIND